MEKMLTFKEKQLVDKALGNPRAVDPMMWPSWSPWVVFALGGFLILSVCVTVLGNWSAFSMRYVLLPGVLTGFVLLLGGAAASRLGSDNRNTCAGKLKLK